MKRALQLLSLLLALSAASAFAAGPIRLIAVSGDGQTVTLGERFPQRVSVKAVDADGRPVVDALVGFMLKTGGTMYISGPSAMWAHIDFAVIPAGFSMYERTDANGVATAPEIRSKRGIGESWVEVSVFDPATVAMVYANVKYTVVLPPGMARPHYQALWWAEGVNPEMKSQRGWGVTVAQNGDRLFVVRYHYGADGRPTWTLSPETRWFEGFSTDNGSYNFLPTGSPYYDYDARRFSANPGQTTTVLFLGAASLAAPEPRAQISSTGWGSANLQPYRSGPAMPTPMPEAEGMWWGGAGQDGWGLAVMDQGGGKYFVVWFTYDANGERTWFAMSDGAWSAQDRTWSGRVYRNRSAQPASTAAEYDGAHVLTEDVGSFSLRFDDANRGHFTYAVEEHRGSMPIERFAF